MRHTIGWRRSNCMPVHEVGVKPDACINNLATRGYGRHNPIKFDPAARDSTKLLLCKMKVNWNGLRTCQSRPDPTAVGGRLIGNSSTSIGN